MLQFLAKRLFSSLIVLFCIMSISFFLMRYAPGGPFDQDRRLPKEVEAKLRERYGFDKPLYQQYLSEMRKYLTGDFGFSYDRPNQTVRELILETFPNSIELGVYAMLIAILLGVPAGLIAGLKQNSALDHSVMSVSMLGVSIPAIALAPLLIYVVVFQLGWLDDYIGWEGVFRILSEPAQKPMESGSIVLGLFGYRFEWIYANLKWVALQKKLLPALTLGVYYAAYFARLSRGGMLEIVRQDYIRTARAKGLSQPAIVWRHALKGALIPAMTYLGPATAAILTGSIVVETIFKIPGVSKYFVTSAFNRDYPMVMGVIVLYSCLLVVMNLLVDIGYTLLDPRVSYDKSELTSQEISDPTVKGRSLAQDAFRRLRRNKLAMLGAVVISVMVLVAASADLLARYVTGFSYEEIHSQLKLLPPGTRDISETYPLYDGDKAAFDLIDLDRSGVIECRHETVTGKDGKSRVSRKVVCPEIRALNEIYETFFLVLFNKFDSAKGPNPANPAALKTTPDGRIYPHEFPSLLTERPIHNPKFQGNPSLVGMRLFNMIDRDGSGFLTFQEVVEFARFMRLDSEKLVREFDRNNDLKISRDEFPGLPKLRTFYLGTDADGRCLLTRLIYGSRISLMVGFLATLVSFLIGVTYGSIAGYFGGRVDNVMMRFVDILYGLPFMFIVILLMVLFGRSIYNLFIALGAVQWLTMSRVIRGQVISIKNEEYVEAARAIGVPTRRIIFSHILRNTVGPVIIYSTLMIPAVILEEAFLSFLGLGVQDPMPSWGTLINDGAKVMQDFPWLITWPGIVLGLTLFCFNFLGDGIRDALDPQVKKS